MLKNIGNFIDALNQWIAKIISPLIVVMTCLVVIDVMLRYVFDSPLIWSWDINIQLFGVFTMLGAGFTLLLRGHVGVDVIMAKLPTKKQAILRIVTFPIFFVGVGIMLWGSVQGAWDSVVAKECYSSYVALPIYPLKVIFLIAILLFFLQGIANLISDIDCIRDRS